jgi:hypothetical protein
MATGVPVNGNFVQSLSDLAIAQAIVTAIMRWKIQNAGHSLRPLSNALCIQR